MICFRPQFARVFTCLASLAFLLGTANPTAAETINGFDLSKATIPLDDVISGGPPRDGIPSIDKPKFLPAGKVDFLEDEDVVVSLTRGEETRAYPLRILVWHEIVNDTIGKEPVAITYCPLCGTSMVFTRKAGEKVRTFGVSGLLYQSDVLMYDRETESLWSQLKMESVSGPSAGKKLTWLDSEHMTWKAWKAKYPEGEVLSTNTGFTRQYQADAYATYFASDRVVAPVPITRRELPNKTWILGIIVGGKAVAYPVEKLPPGKTIRDEVAGRTIQVRYDAKNLHPSVTDGSGKAIPSVLVFWFAWQAFYPETGLWDSSAAED